VVRVHRQEKWQRMLGKRSTQYRDVSELAGKIVPGSILYPDFSQSTDQV